MKTFYFNIQAKGGTGKSMLTYLQAIRNEENDKSLFVDMDSSSCTSSRQLVFLKLKKRLAEITLLNGLHKIDREQIIAVLESMNALENYEEIFLDFGAPESEQLPNLFSIDYSIEEFKELETELDARFVFNIVVAGGGSYLGSCEYLKNVAQIINGKFQVYVYVNQHTFYNHGYLVTELNEFVNQAKGIIAGIKFFGDLYPDIYSTNQIINNIIAGRGMAAFQSFSSRTVLKRELAKL